MADPSVIKKRLEQEMFSLPHYGPMGVEEEEQWCFRGDVKLLIRRLLEEQEKAQELIARWHKAEIDMRVLHGGLPGSGYDKLADGYGTCADELHAILSEGPK